MSNSNGADFNPTKAYAELRNRLKNADYFGRITLASRLINHMPWVRDPAGGGGDMNTAIDRLESDCFPDICGPWYGLATLLELVQHFKDPEEWVKRKNNIKSMVADMQAAKAGRKPKREKPKPTTRDGNAKVSRFEAATPTAMSTMFQQELARVEKFETEVERLRSENATLRNENAELRRENTRLKAFVDRIRTIAV